MLYGLGGTTSNTVGSYDPWSAAIAMKLEVCSINSGGVVPLCWLLAC